VGILVVSAERDGAQDGFDGIWLVLGVNVAGKMVGCVVMLEL